MPNCDCPGTQVLRGAFRDGGFYRTENEATNAANRFADRAERLAQRAGNAAKRAAACNPGPQGQLCICRTSDVKLEPWTAVGAIRTPPAPYTGWLGRGGCTWEVRVDCEIIQLAELEKLGPPRGRKKSGRPKRRPSPSSRRG